MLDGLTGVLGTSQQNHICTSGMSESQLVQSQGLSAGFLDPGAGGGGESEGSHMEFGDSEEAVVIGDGANNGDGLSFVCFLSALGLCLGHEP